jgi:hypothetical protein
MTTTKEQRDEWRRLAEAATPGPAKFDDRPGCKSIKAGKRGNQRQSQYLEIACTTGLYDEAADRANAGLMAEAFTAVPALLDDLAEAEARAKHYEEQAQAFAKRASAMDEENVRLRKKVAAAEAFIYKAEGDHECCDPENCRFCVALAAYRALP